MPFLMTEILTYQAVKTASYLRYVICWIYIISTISYRSIQRRSQHDVSSYSTHFIDHKEAQRRLQPLESFKLFGVRFPDDNNNDNTIPGRITPRPKIITPNRGTHPELEKMMMMYTCKICSERNAQMISKIAYQRGIVVSTCKQCKNKHLIADNEGKLDFPTFGKTIEDFLKLKGERVQRLSLTPQDLEDNYLVDQDGVITLISKAGGQISPESTIVEFPQKPLDN